jgi:hypothetical protein
VACHILVLSRGFRAARLLLFGRPEPERLRQLRKRRRGFQHIRCVPLARRQLQGPHELLRLLSHKRLRLVQQQERLHPQRRCRHERLRRNFGAMLRGRLARISLRHDAHSAFVWSRAMRMKARRAALSAVSVRAPSFGLAWCAACRALAVSDRTSARARLLLLVCVLFPLRQVLRFDRP